MTVEEYLKNKNITIEVNGIKINLTTSKDFEMLLTDYHESQLKAKMPSCENLRNLVYGGKLNPYQRKLALGEFEQIIKK